MRDSTCIWRIVKNVQIPEVMLNIVESSRVQEIIEPLLVYEISFMYHPMVFIDRDKKTKLVPASLSYYYFRIFDFKIINIIML